MEVVKITYKLHHRSLYIPHSHSCYMVIKTLCECGIVVKGKSKLQLETTLKQHKVGRRHKEQMQMKKELKK